MKKRLLQKDAVTGKETWAHFDEDGKMIFESSQNVDALLANNRDERNEYRSGSLQGNTQRHQQKVAGQGEQVVFDGKTGKEKSRKMIPTHYMKRGYEAERQKEQFGSYPYDPKFDKDKDLYNQYQTYSMESRFGYYGGPPPMMQKASKTSKFAKDAKLYMTEDHWNMTFA